MNTGDKMNKFLCEVSKHWWQWVYSLQYMINHQGGHNYNIIKVFNMHITTQQAHNHHNQFDFNIRNQVGCKLTNLEFNGEILLNSMIISSWSFQLSYVITTKTICVCIIQTKINQCFKWKLKCKINFVKNKYLQLRATWIFNI